MRGAVQIAFLIVLLVLTIVAGIVVGISYYRTHQPPAVPIKAQPVRTTAPTFHTASVVQ